MEQSGGAEPAQGTTLDPIQPGERLERFQPTIGRWLGWAAIGLAGVLALDVVRDGLTRDNASDLALLVAVSTLIYMVMIRPRVIAYENVLRVKNIASDTDLPWSRIESVKRRQTLRIKTDAGTVNCVAAPQSATRVMKSGHREFEFVNGIPYQEYVVLKAVSYISQRGPEVPRRAAIVRRWAWAELAVLAVATVVVLVGWVA